jgi:hypothetical protein
MDDVYKAHVISDFRFEVAEVCVLLGYAQRIVVRNVMFCGPFICHRVSTHFQLIIIIIIIIIILIIIISAH